MLLLLALAVAAGWVTVYALTPNEGRQLVAWYAGAAGVFLLTTVATTAFSRRAVHRLRTRLASQEADANQLIDASIPEFVRRFRAGDSLDTALAGLPGVTDDRQRAALRLLAEELSRDERGKAAALAACANAASRVQALTTSIMAELREMQDRADEDTLGDLLRLDHSTAQAGRLADSVAVLTGARSGRRWTKPIVMESILRGAVSRINAYQRVRLHSAVGVAVVGYAAEGIIHLLAELIDNATQFSPPSAEVHVYVEEGHAGVVVTVEDSGLGMRDRALVRAEQMLAAGASDLSGLAGTRLGLAVVGRLAGKYGLRVSFRPSSRGGTGVVVMIPRTLITEVEPQQPAALDRSDELAQVTASAVPRPVARVVEELLPVAAEPEHLPQRLRGQALAAALATAPTPPVQAATRRERSDPGTAFGAFRQAVRSDLSQDDTPTMKLRLHGDRDQSTPTDH
jgi:signal transduction histidine kinase